LFFLLSSSRRNEKRRGKKRDKKNRRRGEENRLLLPQDGVCVTRRKCLARTRTPALLCLFDGGTDGAVADVGPDDLTVRNKLAILIDKREQIGEWEFFIK
jgi:hypothetical protein